MGEPEKSVLLIRLHILQRMSRFTALMHCQNVTHMISRPFNASSLSLLPNQIGIQSPILKTLQLDLLGNSNDKSSRVGEVTFSFKLIEMSY